MRVINNVSPLRYRMTARRERGTTTARSPNGGPDRSLSSSHHPSPVYSSPRPSTPALRPTRATSARPFASPTTLSPCPPTRPRPSSAPFGRARASTSPPSSRLPRPVVRACPLPPPPNRPLAACCVPVSVKPSRHLYVHTLSEHLQQPICKHVSFSHMTVITVIKSTLFQRVLLVYD